MFGWGRAKYTANEKGPQAMKLPVMPIKKAKFTVCIVRGISLSFTRRNLMYNPVQKAINKVKTMIEERSKKDEAELKAKVAELLAPALADYEKAFEKEN